MGIKIYVIKPGILISQWLTGSGATIPDGRVSARSAWTDVTKITHFEFDFEGRAKKVTSIYKRRISPGNRIQTVPLRKIDRMVQYRDDHLGNFNDDGGLKFEQALEYAISEWGKIAKGSGDIGKYSTIVRGTSESSELGGTFTSVNSNGDYIWKFGTGFVRFTASIKDYSIDEDRTNNVIVKSLTLEGGNI